MTLKKDLWARNINNIRALGQMNVAYLVFSFQDEEGGDDA